MRQTILNIAVNDLTLAELLAEFREGMLVTPNVDHLVMLQHDEMFYNAYRAAEYSTVDSQIVLWAMKFLGRRVQEKISGSDFLPAFCDYHARAGRQNVAQPLPNRLFLLGGREGVAARAQDRINLRTGSELVIAAHSPSMQFVDDIDECDLVLDLINNSRATVLVVGLGAPKQEIWIHKHRSRMPHVKMFLAVGAAIDFEAGILERSPGWVSRAGFEWLFRLYKEPNRLWRRYLIRDPRFFWLLLLDRFSVYKNPFIRF